MFKEKNNTKHKRDMSSFTNETDGRQSKYKCDMRLVKDETHIENRVQRERCDVMKHLLTSLFF
jgi:hypothetical protein